MAVSRPSPASPGVTRVGFVGLGIMGAPMALNLLEAGYQVCAYNRSDRSAVDAVLAAGARRAGTPAEAAGEAEVVIVMVTDSADVEQVVLGAEGIIHGIRAGGVVIDMSTISPRVTRQIAARLSEVGVRLLDAPVSGGETGAKNGMLSIMVGGEQDVFDACLPLLQAMGRTITLIGPNGAGQTTKLCNQVAGVLANLAMSEALMLAAASGLDAERVLQAISGGAAGSWQMANLAPKILQRDFAPGFMVDLQQKDLRLVVQAANDVGMALPGVSLVHQLLNAVQRAGCGREGTQSLIKAYEMQSGVEARAGG